MEDVRTIPAGRSRAAWIAQASDHVLSNVIPRLESLGMRQPDSVELRMAIVVALCELHEKGALDALDETERRFASAMSRT